MAENPREKTRELIFLLVFLSFSKSMNQIEAKFSKKGN